MKHATTRTNTLLAVAAALLTASGAALDAQTVRGTLLEEETGEPILLGSVFLADTTRAVVDQTITDHEGAFALTAPGPGAYYVGATKMGYESRLDGVLELGEGGQISIEFYLVTDPIELEQLDVQVSRERVDTYLAQTGFYERREQGSGTYFGPDQLEGREGMAVSSLLENVPGLTSRVGGSANTGSGRILARQANSSLSPGNTGGRLNDETPPGYCTPRLFLDGAEQNAMSSGAGLEIDTFLNMEDLVAVEAFPRIAHIPLEWAGSNSSCGIILAWTKAGAANSGG